MDSEYQEDALVALDHEEQESLVPVPLSQVTNQAAQIARTVADIVKKQKLSVTIGNKEHVMCEGWTSMLAMMGVTPQEESVERLPDGSYVAHVRLVRTRDGMVVGRGSAECGMDEPKWAGSPSYARRSMSVTRATGKAARLSFSWIMSLAGYAATPFEEMDGISLDGPEPDADDPGNVLIKVGRDKGTPISDVDVGSLQWNLKVHKEGAADPKKKKWKRENEAMVAALQAELERRGSGEDMEIPF